MNLQRTSRVVGHHRPVRRDQGADDQDLLLAVRPLRAGDAFLPDSPPDLSRGRCRGILAASTEWAQTSVYGFSLYLHMNSHLHSTMSSRLLIWSFFYWFIGHYFSKIEFYMNLHAVLKEISQRRSEVNSHLKWKVLHWTMTWTRLYLSICRILPSGAHLLHAAHPPCLLVHHQGGTCQIFLWSSY